MKEHHFILLIDRVGSLQRLSGVLFILLQGFGNKN